MYPTLLPSAVSVPSSAAVIFTAETSALSVPDSTQQQRRPGSATGKEGSSFETFDDQLVSLLDSGDPERQSTALTIIINVRRRQPQMYDFADCVASLLRIYRSNQNEETRLLALAALNAVGTPAAYEGLRTSLPEVRSRRVRRQTVLLLRSEGANGYVS